MNKYIILIFCLLVFICDLSIYFIKIINNNKRQIFSFMRYKNDELSKQLKNDVKEIFVIEGQIFNSLIYRLIGYFIIFDCTLYKNIIYYGIVIGVFFILLGINELIKEFSIIDNKFIYKRLLFSKSISFSDISKITYNRHMGVGKYRNQAPITYDIKIFKNDRCLIKVSYVSENSLKLLKDISKKNKIKINKNV